MTSMRTRLSPGLPVVTNDDHELGKVKEIHGAYFKVDAPMARDYWLAMEIVHEVKPECVSVDFTKAQLDDYRLSEPSDNVLSPSPILDEAANAIHEGPEKAATRAGMREGYPSEISEMPDSAAGAYTHEPDSAGTAEEPEGSILGSKDERLEARRRIEEELEAARREREAAHS